MATSRNTVVLLVAGGGPPRDIGTLGRNLNFALNPFAADADVGG
jgi:hypothetical protein